VQAYCECESDGLRDAHHCASPTFSRAPTLPLSTKAVPPTIGPRPVKLVRSSNASALKFRAVNTVSKRLLGDALGNRTSSRCNWSRYVYDNIGSCRTTMTQYRIQKKKKHPHSSVSRFYIVCFVLDCGPFAHAVCLHLHCFVVLSACIVRRPRMPHSELYHLSCSTLLLKNFTYDSCFTPDVPKCTGEWNRDHNKETTMQRKDRRKRTKITIAS
jgi:hypothetical protein